MYDGDNDVKRIFSDDSRQKKRIGIGIHARASRRGYIRGGIRTQYDFLTSKQKKLLNGEVRISNMYEQYKNLENCDLNEILATKTKVEIKGILNTIRENNTCKDICSALHISNGKLYSLYKKYEIHTEKKPRKKKTDAIGLPDVMKKDDFKKLSAEDKGKYIFGMKDSDGFSLSDLSKHFGVSKNSLNYYVTKYNNITGNSIPNVSEVENNAIETNKNDEYIIKISELEKERDKLMEHILSLTKKDGKKPNGLHININGDYTKEELSNRLSSLDIIAVENRKYRLSLSLEELTEA